MSRIPPSGVRQKVRIGGRIGKKIQEVPLPKLNAVFCSDKDKLKKGMR